MRNRILGGICVLLGSGSLVGAFLAPDHPLLILGVGALLLAAGLYSLVTGKGGDRNVLHVLHPAFLVALLALFVFGTMSTINTISDGVRQSKQDVENLKRSVDELKAQVDRLESKATTQTK